MRSFYLYLLPGLVWTITGGVELVIPPRSVNATLNSTVSFQCRATVDATAHRWSINGTLVLVDSIRRDGNTSGVEVFCNEDQYLTEITQCGLLRIDGNGFSMVFNASVLEVRCGLFVINNGTLATIFSDPALLQIQGLLGPVTNLAVQSTTNTSITLRWDPPFSLDITGVEPDFTHTAEVYSNGERELVNATRNIINPTFTFSLVNPDPLDLFQFVVFAVNAVGEGERSDSVKARFSEVSIIDAPTTASPTTTGTSNTYADDQTTGTVSMETMCTTVCQVPSQASDSLFVPVTITAFVVGVVLGVVATLLIVLLATVYTRTHVNNVKQSSTEEEEIELKRCDAYDVVSKKKKIKRRPVVNPPPVYEEVDL